MSEAPQRALPSVDRLLRTPPVSSLLLEFAREPVLNLTRAVLREYREAAAAGKCIPEPEVLAAHIAQRAREEWEIGPRPVINATGVVLHTNLGRAPLSREAVAAMQHASAYSDLEYDLAGGKRGSRQSHVAAMITALTGADAAFVAVNNAAAMLLALTAVARRREVIVSRGQAVEIGGGFRVPVILQQSGARLVEVGTTNRTRIVDYADAITPQTAAILHVHSSNFRIVGFAENTPLPELAALCRRQHIELLVDNGSGSILDTSQFGLAHEPMPQEAIAAGAGLVTFSGDKLLGGPQCGIVIGSRELVGRLARHPLARALRPDKTILAGLAATLRSYFRGTAVEDLPIWRAIAASPATLHTRAEAWSARARECGLAVELAADESTVGGGSLPGETVPTTIILLPRNVSSRRLRRNDVSPVVTRVVEARPAIDLRTVPQDQEDELLSAVCAAAGITPNTRAMVDSGVL